MAVRLTLVWVLALGSVLVKLLATTQSHRPYLQVSEVRLLALAHLDPTVVRQLLARTCEVERVLLEVNVGDPWQQEQLCLVRPPLVARAATFEHKFHFRHLSDVAVAF